MGAEGEAGIVLAQDQSGLTSTVPAGPRFSAKPATGGLPGPKELIKTLASSPRGIKLLGQPFRIAFGAEHGVASTVQQSLGGRSIVSEEIVVSLGPERAYTLTLEAPADQWSSNQEIFKGILGSVSFNRSAVPAARGS